MKHNRIAAFPTVLTLALTALATQGTAHAQPRVAPAALNPSVNPSVVTQFQASPDMDEVKEQRLIRVSKATALAPTEPKALEPGSAVAGGDILLDLDFISVNMPPDGDGPTEIAFSADGSTFVISHRDSQNLVVFDAETRNVAQTIPLSGSPNSLALTADGVYAVTANLYEDTASIVDLTLGAEVAVVAVGDQPGVVRITPDDSLAVVGNTIDGDLSIINIASAIETKRLPAAGFVQSLSFGAFGFDVDFTDYKITPGNTVIFPARFDDQILFIDIDSGATTAVDSEPDPRMIDLSSDGKTAVVSHSSSESHVSVIDTVTQTIFKSIPVGGSSGISPRIAINNEKTKAVVSSLNHVRVVDIENETVSEDLHTGAVVVERYDAEPRRLHFGHLRQLQQQRLDHRYHHLDGNRPGPGGKFSDPSCVCAGLRNPLCQQSRR